MNAPAVLIFLLLVYSLFKPISWLTYLVFMLPVFGTLAMLPSSALGGANLTPGPLAALFFIMKALTMPVVRRGALEAITDMRQLGLLWLFFIVAALGAFILPHVFDGAIQAYPMRAIHMEYIKPSLANYNQAAYLMLSVLMAVVGAGLARDPAFIAMLPKAILAGVCAVVASGLLDMAASAAGLSDVLEVFRTSNYAIMVEGYVLGARRVIGLMPEASSYGGMAVGIFSLILFMQPIYSKAMRRWKVPLATAVCGLMAILSTSSTAYVMLAVVMGFYVLYDIKEVTSDNVIVRQTIIRKFWGLVAVFFAILLVMVFDSDFANYVMQFLDKMIFRKHETSSFAERGRWTGAAIDALMDSGGFGVGVGSVRTSNMFVNIFASTGFLGGGLFMLFIILMFMRRLPASEPRLQVIARAAKVTILCGFVGAALAGTTPDFGTTNGILFGLIMGMGRTSKEPRPALLPQGARIAASDAQRAP